MEKENKSKNDDKTNEIDIHLKSNRNSVTGGSQNWMQKEDKKGDLIIDQRQSGFEINPIPVTLQRESQITSLKKIYKDEDDYFNQDVLNQGSEPK